MNRIKLFFIFVIFCLFIFLQPQSIKAAENDFISAVYFTGVGCPHCAGTDPFIFEQLLKEYPHLIIFEYEVYQKKENAPLLLEYNQNYKSGLSIPLIIFNKGNFITGDKPIIGNSKKVISEITDFNTFPAINGQDINLKQSNISSLPGKPSIWRDQRVLISSGQMIQNYQVLKDLLFSDNLDELFNQNSFKKVNPQPIPLSGKNIYFDYAINFEGWIFQWNDNDLIDKTGLGNNTNNLIANDSIALNNQTDKLNLTIAKISSLAVVDAINPCALAVLTLMLFAIITYSPKKRKNILLAGLAFSASVFIMYLFYGLVIIRFLQLVQVLTGIRLWLYKILGLAAIILGILNIKDFIRYKPGGFLTEMPLSLRPKMQSFLFKVTRPRGAFVIGALVTLFLLPCTIGPYVITGGILSSLQLVKTIPWLLFYNLIFVMPMIFVTLICYGGFTSVEKVSGWKDKNIKYLHLITGSIIFALGLAMFFGWI